MKECLVDVLNANDTVLHVISVAVKNPEGVARDVESLREALKMAGHLHLVPDDKLKTLKARMHVERRGPLTPVGSVMQVRQQAQKRGEQRIRMCAYFLWQREGFPKHRADEHWYQASDLESQILPNQNDDERVAFYS